MRHRKIFFQFIYLLSICAYIQAKNVGINLPCNKELDGLLAQDPDGNESAFMSCQGVGVGTIGFWERKICPDGMVFDFINQECRVKTKKARKQQVLNIAILNNSCAKGETCIGGTVCDLDTLKCLCPYGTTPHLGTLSCESSEPAYIAAELPARYVNGADNSDKSSVGFLPNSNSNIMNAASSLFNSFQSSAQMQPFKFSNFPSTGSNLANNGPFNFNWNQNQQNQNGYQNPGFLPSPGNSNSNSFTPKPANPFASNNGQQIPSSSKKIPILAPPGKSCRNNEVCIGGSICTLPIGLCLCPGELEERDGECVLPPRHGPAIHKVGIGAVCNEMAECDDGSTCVLGRCTCVAPLVQHEGKCVLKATRKEVGPGELCDQGELCVKGSVCDPVIPVCVCPVDHDLHNGECVRIVPALPPPPPPPINPHPLPVMVPPPHPAHPTPVVHSSNQIPGLLPEPGASRRPNPPYIAPTANTHVSSPPPPQTYTYRPPAQTAAPQSNNINNYNSYINAGNYQPEAFLPASRTTERPTPSLPRATQTPYRPPQPPTVKPMVKPNPLKMGGSKQAGVGVRCSLNTDCMIGAYCNGNTNPPSCQCLSTHVNIEGRCEKAIFPGQVGCKSDEQCRATDVNTSCIDRICVCEEGKKAVDSVCVNDPSFTPTTNSSSSPLKQRKLTHIPCYPACRKPYICVQRQCVLRRLISTGELVREDDNDESATPRRIKRTRRKADDLMTCWPGAASCSEGNGVCIDSQCNCLRGWRERDGRCQPPISKQIPLDGSCDVFDRESVCINGTLCIEGRCQCAFPKGCQFLPRRADEKCSTNADCTGGRACVEERCRCNPGSEFMNDTCVAVMGAFKNINSQCSALDRCAGGAVCKDHVCSCTDESYEQQGKCRTAPGGHCSNGQACDSGSFCELGLCRCPDGQSIVSGRCLPATAEPGQSCQNNERCLHGSACRFGICMCFGSYVTVNNRCIRKENLVVTKPDEKEKSRKPINTVPKITKEAVLDKSATPTSAIQTGNIRVPGTRCEALDKCTGNSICKDGYCTCSSEFEVIIGDHCVGNQDQAHEVIRHIAVAAPGQECDPRTNCTGGAKCVNHQCVCEETGIIPLPGAIGCQPDQSTANQLPESDLTSESTPPNAIQKGLLPGSLCRLTLECPYRTECIRGVCRCKKDETIVDGTCRQAIHSVMPGGKCDPKNGQDCVGESHCVYGICTCQRHLVPNGKECSSLDEMEMVNPGKSCKHGQLCNYGSSCVNNICRCGSGEVIDVNGKCVSKKNVYPVFNRLPRPDDGRFEGRVKQVIEMEKTAGNQFPVSSFPNKPIAIEITIFGITCDDIRDCPVNSYCQDASCRCTGGFRAVDDGCEMMKDLPKDLLAKPGDECMRRGQICSFNSYCSIMSGVCECPSGMGTNQGRCELTFERPGSACVTSRNCHKFSYCDNGRCLCKSGYMLINNFCLPPAIPLTEEHTKAGEGLLNGNDIPMPPNRNFGPNPIESQLRKGLLPGTLPNISPPVVSPLQPRPTISTTIQHETTTFFGPPPPPPAKSVSLPVPMGCRMGYACRPQQNPQGNFKVETATPGFQFKPYPVSPLTATTAVWPIESPPPTLIPHQPNDNSIFVPEQPMRVVSKASPTIKIDPMIKNFVDNNIKFAMPGEYCSNGAIICLGNSVCGLQFCRCSFNAPAENGICTPRTMEELKLRQKYSPNQPKSFEQIMMNPSGMQHADTHINSHSERQIAKPLENCENNEFCTGGSACETINGLGQICQCPTSMVFLDDECIYPPSSADLAGILEPCTPNTICLGASVCSTASQCICPPLHRQVLGICIRTAEPGDDCSNGAVCVDGAVCSGSERICICPTGTRSQAGKCVGMDEGEEENFEPEDKFEEEQENFMQFAPIKKKMASAKTFKVDPQMNSANSSNEIWHNGHKHRTAHPGEACDSSILCVDNSFCNSGGFCECLEKFGNVQGHCVPSSMIRKPSEPCHPGNICSSGSVCQENYCRCPQGKILIENHCLSISRRFRKKDDVIPEEETKFSKRKQHTSSDMKCSIDADCPAHFACQESLCICYGNSSVCLNLKSSVLARDDSCNVDGHCPENSICDEGICICEDEYKMEDGECVLRTRETDSESFEYTTKPVPEESEEAEPVVAENGVEEEEEDHGQEEDSQEEDTDIEYVAPGSNCSDNSTRQCGNDSICFLGACVCSYEDMPLDDVCVVRDGHVRFGHRCSPSSRCASGLICLANKCMCAFGNVECNPNDPVTSPPGGSCSEARECTGGSVCREGWCICPDPHMIVQKGICIQSGIRPTLPPKQPSHPATPTLPAYQTAAPIPTYRPKPIHKPTVSQPSYNSHSANGRKAAPGSSCGPLDTCVGGSACIDNICICPLGMEPTQSGRCEKSSSHQSHHPHQTVSSAGSHKSNNKDKQKIFPASGSYEEPLYTRRPPPFIALPTHVPLTTSAAKEKKPTQATSGGEYDECLARGLICKGNTICKNKSCQCPDGYVLHHDGCIPPDELDSNTVGGEAAQAQASLVNAGGKRNVRTKSRHQASKPTVYSQPGGECGNGQVCTGGSSCNSRNICMCPADRPKVKDEECVRPEKPEKKESAPGQACDDTSVCIRGSTCINGYCRCGSGYVAVAGYCASVPQTTTNKALKKAKPLESCDGGEICEGGSDCDEDTGICMCPRGQIVFGSQCMDPPTKTTSPAITPETKKPFTYQTEQPPIGSTECESDANCGDNKICLSGRCKCMPGFIDNLGLCEPLEKIGEAERPVPVSYARHKAMTLNERMREDDEEEAEVVVRTERPASAEEEVEEMTTSAETEPPTTTRRATTTRPPKRSEVTQRPRVVGPPIRRPKPKKNKGSGGRSGSGSSRPGGTGPGSYKTGSGNGNCPPGNEATMDEEGRLIVCNGLEPNCPPRSYCYITSGGFATEEYNCCLRPRLLKYGQPCDRYSDRCTNGAKCIDAVCKCPSGFALSPSGWCERYDARKGVFNSLATSLNGKPFFPSQGQDPSSPADKSFPTPTQLAYVVASKMQQQLEELAEQYGYKPHELPKIGGGVEIKTKQPSPTPMAGFVQPSGKSIAKAVEVDHVDEEEPDSEFPNPQGYGRFVNTQPIQTRPTTRYHSTQRSTRRPSTRITSVEPQTTRPPSSGGRRTPIGYGCDPEDECQNGSECRFGFCTCPDGKIEESGSCIEANQEQMNLRHAGESCDSGAICIGGAICDSDSRKCICGAGHVAINGICKNKNSRTFVLPGDSCRNGEGCSGNSFCKDGMCECEHDHFVQDGYCRHIASHSSQIQYVSGAGLRFSSKLEARPFATSCNEDTCHLPDCFCSQTGKTPPGGLPPSQTPQFIVLTFDDAVNGKTFPDYLHLFQQTKYRNPNGCPIKATFFISHEWTNYDSVQWISAQGMELASNSISHVSLADEDSGRWLNEMDGQRRIMAKFAGVPEESIVGMRAPQLAAGADSQFEMMTRAGFIWDNTLSANPGINSDPFWPQTLDHRVPWNCHEQGCPQSAFPGIWEIPLNQFYGAYMKQIDSYRRSSMIRAAVDLNNTVEELTAMLVSNFDRAYSSNKAPFVLSLNADFLQLNGKHWGMQALERFLNEVMANKDVYVVTMKQLVDWMKNPTPLSRINESEALRCPISFRQHNSDTPLTCETPNKCMYRTPGLNSPEHQFLTCTPCPDLYPWIENPSGTTSILR